MADQVGVPVEDHKGLAEGAPAELTMSLLESHAQHSVALCSHGDVIPRALVQIEAGGVRVKGDHHTQKGGWWELGTDGSHINSAVYHPPVTR